MALLGPQHVCPSCGLDAPLAAGLSSAIEATRVAMLNLPLRERQLQTGERLVAGLDQSSHKLRWWWALLLVPLIIAEVFGLTFMTTESWADPEQRFDVTLSALIVPLFIHVVCGWVLRRRTLRAARDIRMQLQVRPMQGGSYACRTCGAPIAPSDLDAPIIECVHCHSHNVFDRDAALDAATEELVTFDSLQPAVLARARHTRPSARTAAALVAAGPLSLFVISVACWQTDLRMEKAFYPDATLDAPAYKSGVRHCLELKDSKYTERVPLQPLVGTTLYFGREPYVLGRVGKDGWGRVWLQSTDGRWSRPTELCWPKLEP